MNDRDPLATLQAAFAQAQRPVNAKLLHPDCRDDGDIAEYYGCPDWESLSDAFIVRNYASLLFLSPSAFRYYLPAFLLWLIRNPKSPEIAAETIFLSLDPGTESEHLHAFRMSTQFNADWVLSQPSDIRSETRLAKPECRRRSTLIFGGRRNYKAKISMKRCAKCQ